MSAHVLRLPSRDVAILGGSLKLVRRGVWQAVVEVHGDAALAELSPASIVLKRESGAEDVLVGAVRVSAVDPGGERVSVTVVGGKGLLAKVLPPRDDAKGATEIPAGLVAKAIVTDAGEMLADGVEAALDAFTVPHWLRTRGRGDDALDLLVHILGLSWRPLANGRIWVGAETWPTVDRPQRLGYELEDGGVKYAPDGLRILPGQLVDSRRVEEGVYFFGGALTCEARTVQAADPRHEPDRTLYRQTYGARVVGQDDAGLLELVPDDPAIGDEDHPLRGVSFRIGIPGSFATIPVGSRVRLAFESADPRAPFAMAPDQVNPSEVITQPLALVGDRGNGGTLTGIADLVTGVVTFTYTPPYLAPPSAGPSVSLATVITGPGHRDVKGVPGS